MTPYPDTQLFIDGPWDPIAAFAPWTFPINQVVRKTSAALAAGCSIIAKGPEGTPASPAALVRTFADAGVPAGVINLVYGDPATIRLPHPASGDPRDHLHGLDASGQEARRNGGRAHEARDAS